MKTKVTIRDIAAACGVTTATVSRVINNQPGVRKEIRKFVQRHIDQLGWQCSSLKTRLPKAGSVKTVFILCNMETLSGGGRYSIQSALQLLIGRLEEAGIIPFAVFGKTLQMLDECRRLKPHAVLLLTKTPWQEEAVRRLAGTGTRVAVAYGDRFCGSCPQVRSDYEAAARKAVRRLRSLGCRRIGLFAGNGMLVHPGGPEDVMQFWVRCIAQVLMRDMPGFVLERDMVSDCFNAPDELRRMVGSGDYDGWICCEHERVKRFCQEAEALGIRVPEQLPVVAFCSESAGYEDVLRMDHFVSQVEKIADQLFRWVTEETFPEPVEVVIPYLWQKGTALLPDQYKKKHQNNKER